MRTTWNLSGNKTKITFLLTLYFIFLCSIDTFSKEFHNGGICGGDCMVVPQFDKFEEKNPDINPESKTPKKNWQEYWDNGRLKTEIHFKNGATYTGQWLGNMKHGYGV